MGRDYLQGVSQEETMIPRRKHPMGFARTKLAERIAELLQLAMLIDERGMLTQEQCALISEFHDLCVKWEARIEP